MTFSLGSAQGLHVDEPNEEDEQPGSVHSATAPPEETEEKEQHETAHAPVSFGEAEQPASASEAGGGLSAGDVTDALRPPALSPVQFSGGGFGGGASAHQPAVPPGSSPRALEHNALAQAATSSLTGTRRSLVAQGRSASDLNAAMFGRQS